MSHDPWLPRVYSPTPQQIWSCSWPIATSVSLQANYHICSAGWLESGRVAYPTAYASQNCGSGLVGIVDYGPRNNKSEMWDVFCYRVKGNAPSCTFDSRPHSWWAILGLASQSSRVKLAAEVPAMCLCLPDVNCTCKVGYVGDGFSCSGNLLEVLMSFPSLTNFLTVGTMSARFHSGKEGLPQSRRQRLTVMVRSMGTGPHCLNLKLGFATCCITLKLLSPLGLSFLVCIMEIMIAPTSSDHCDN